MNLLENPDGVRRQCPLDEPASIYADVRSLLMTSHIEGLSEVGGNVVFNGFVKHACLLPRRDIF